MTTGNTSLRFRYSLVVLAVAVSFVSALIVIIGGPLYRFGAVDLQAAFLLLRSGALGALAGAVLCLVAAVFTWYGIGRRGFPLAVAGLLVGLAAAAVPLYLLRAARAAPPIHDITTDTRDPPAFVAVLPHRQGAPNPPEYGGPGVAMQQQAAYPDLKSLDLPLAPPEAFRRAEAAMRAMGLEIVAADLAAGRIEATATTFWFGFKDDVVVRIRGIDTNGQVTSRIDVRSESRIGQGDLGTNAARVRKLLARISEG